MSYGVHEGIENMQHEYWKQLRRPPLEPIEGGSCSAKSVFSVDLIASRYKMKEEKNKSNKFFQRGSSLFGMEFKKKGLAWAENIFDNVNMEVLGLDSFRERACKFYDVYLEACDLLERESNQTLIGGVVHDGKCMKLDSGVPADSLPDMLDMTYCGNDHPSMSNYEIEESELTCSGNGVSEAPTVSSLSQEQRGQMGASGNDHCKDGELKTLPEIGSSELQEQCDQMGSCGNDHWQDSEIDMLPEIESFELQEQCDQLESSGNDHWPDSETDIDTRPEIEIAEEDSAGNKPSLHPGSLDYFVCWEEDIDLVDLNSVPLLEEFETVKLGKYGQTEEDGKSRLTAHANMNLSYKSPDGIEH
ncbi:hypothetical protein QJS10_CPB12g01027 [Acorus calamus]|uniref:Uncharacterized protein n=1 Tax=Acorus calamus TaxID=4465 RepID=A0AAV9DPH5_ACOCL|nr:hypothetical protein QJS10_CPB12g01027 [Acorus calamus]